MTICTDSQSAIKSINGCKCSSSLVLECRDTLQELSKDHHETRVSLVKEAFCNCKTKNSTSSLVKQNMESIQCMTRCMTKLGRIYFLCSDTEVAHRRPKVM